MSSYLLNKTGRTHVVNFRYAVFVTFINDIGIIKTEYYENTKPESHLSKMKQKHGKTFRIIQTETRDNKTGETKTVKHQESALNKDQVNKENNEKN